MENRPEYVAAWLGLLKVGAVVALINTNLRGTAARPFDLHRRRAARHRRRRTGRDLSARRRRRSSRDRRPGARAARSPGLEDLDAALAAQLRRACRPRPGAPASPARTRRSTSTPRARRGCPRPRTSRHLRMLFMMHGFAGGLEREGERPDVQCAAALSFGGRRLRARPGASHRRIGDLEAQILGARILGRCAPLQGDALPVYRRALPLPPERADIARTKRDHAIRAITGNGLRPEIWPNFQDALRDSEDHRVLRRHRRQRLDAEL